jgi:hypothetical protein
MYGKISCLEALTLQDNIGISDMQAEALIQARCNTVKTYQILMVGAALLFLYAGQISANLLTTSLVTPQDLLPSSFFEPGYFGLDELFVIDIQSIRMIPQTVSKSQEQR